MPARSPTPTLASKKAPESTPTTFRSAVARRPAAHPAQHPSSPLSMPTALDPSKRHAPRLAALLAARAHDLQRVPRLGSRYTGAIACTTLYDVHALETIPGCTLAPPRTTSRMHSTPHRLHRLPASGVPSRERCTALTARKHEPAVLRGIPFTTSWFCSARHGCSPLPAPPLPPPRAPSSSAASRTLSVHARASPHLQCDIAHP
jgi:hypothetical protein